MSRKIVVAALICILPFTSFGQDKPSKHKKSKHKTTKTAVLKKLPEWAPAHNYDATAHVYFPDYYTYYDPARGGYVYWDKGGYNFTPTVPPFLEKVDLGKSRIQILKGVSLDMHPELDYPHYMELYPPDGNNNTLVPVPIPSNPGQR